MMTKRTVLAFCFSALLAAVLLLQLGCNAQAQTQSASPEPISSVAQGTPHTTGVPAVSGSQNFWNATTIQQAEQIAGYKIYSPAYIPAGFEPGSAFMVETMGIGPNAYKVVDRIWMLTSDHTVHFELVQSPKDLEPGNSQPAEVAGTTGERAEQTIGGLPGVELGWQQGDAYFTLSGTMKSPLTENVLDKIAGSIE